MNWKALAPHRPLGIGDTLHVPRPSGDGSRLASMLRNGLGPLAVSGPVGSGKSTELAAAAGALQADFPTCPLPLDRLVNLRNFTENEILAKTLSQLAASFKLSVPPPLISVHELNTYNPNVFRDIILSTARQIKKQAASGRLALLVDGLEKCPEESARLAVRLFLQFKEELDLILVVPPSLVLGPDSYEMLSELRVFPVRPVPVLEWPGGKWQEGRAFLESVFKRRMGQESERPELIPIVQAAILASGGLPRTFLQILHAAAGYAGMANRELPGKEDLEDALRDQEDSLRRLLRDGDLESMRQVRGTDGIEMPLERRIQLLTLGLLLEVEVSDKVLIIPHPLLDPGIQRLLSSTRQTSS